VTATVRAYRLAIREFAEQTNRSVWYSHQAIDPTTPGPRAVPSKKSRQSRRSSIGRAYARDSIAAQRKLTERVDGRLRIINNPPVVVPVRELDFAEFGPDLDERMHGLLDDYVRTLPPDRRRLVEQYRVVGADDQDPLFLQAIGARFSRRTP
jgi:hypothetical protein